MKKQYQIRAQRAIDQFQEWANGEVDPIQLSLPTADVLKLAQRSLGELLRQVGKVFVENVLEAEVEHVAGERSKPDPKREAYRWGSEHGYVVIDGQEVPIEKPRVRTRQNNREIPLGSYELFQRAGLIQETVWQKILYGLTALVQTRGWRAMMKRCNGPVPIEGLLKGRHFDRQIIVWCVSWYTSFELSLRDVGDHDGGSGDLRDPYHDPAVGAALPSRVREALVKGQYKTSKLGGRKATMTELWNAALAA